MDQHRRRQPPRGPRQRIGQPPPLKHPPGEPAAHGLRSAAHHRSVPPPTANVTGDKDQDVPG